MGTDNNLEQHFVGRQEELDLLENNFDDKRILSIFGPKGIGKSRLAFEFLNRRKVRIIHCNFVNVRKLPGVVKILCKSFNPPLPCPDVRYDDDYENNDDFIHEFNSFIDKVIERINQDGDSTVVLFLDNMEFAKSENTENRYRTSLFDYVYEYIIDRILECKQTKVLITSTVCYKFLKWRAAVSKCTLKGLLDADAMALLKSLIVHSEEDEDEAISTVCKLCFGYPDAIISTGQLLQEGLFNIEDMMNLLAERALQVLGNEFLPAAERQDVKQQRWFNRLLPRYQEAIEKMAVMPEDTNIKDCAVRLGYDRNEMALFKLNVLMPLNGRSFIEVSREENWRIEVLSFMKLFVQRDSVEENIKRRINDMLEKQDDQHKTDEESQRKDKTDAVAESTNNRNILLPSAISGDTTADDKKLQTNTDCHVNETSEGKKMLENQKVTGIEKNADVNLNLLNKDTGAKDRHMNTEYNLQLSTDENNPGISSELTTSSGSSITKGFKTPECKQLPINDISFQKKASSSILNPQGQDKHQMDLKGKHLDSCESSCLNSNGGMTTPHFPTLFSSCDSNKELNFSAECDIKEAETDKKVLFSPSLKPNGTTDPIEHPISCFSCTNHVSAMSCGSAVPGSGGPGSLYSVGSQYDAMVIDNQVTPETVCQSGTVPKELLENSHERRGKNVTESMSGNNMASNASSTAYISDSNVKDCHEVFDSHTQWGCKTPGGINVNSDDHKSLPQSTASKKSETWYQRWYQGYTAILSYIEHY